MIRCRSCGYRADDTWAQAERVLECLKIAITDGQTLPWSVAHGSDVVARAWPRCIYVHIMQSLLWWAGLERESYLRLFCEPHAAAVAACNERQSGDGRCGDCREVVLRLYPAMSLARLLESAKATEGRR